MDRLLTKVPSIRLQHKIKNPVVFVANLSAAQYKAAGDTFYKPMMRAIKYQPNVDQSKVHFLPNVVRQDFTVEKRAEMLADHIKTNFKNQKVHLVGHSFVGIDLRAATGMMGLGSDHVKSVTTLSSPHLGCRLVDQTMKYPEHFEAHRLEKAYEMLGMSGSNVVEFNSVNMGHFNEVCADVKGVGYYSFGSKKKEMHINELLRPGYAIITEHKINYECDGIIETNECRWGQYLVTFDHDHFELAGFNPQVRPTHVANLFTDNIRYCELQQDGDKSIEKSGTGQKKKTKA